MEIREITVENFRCFSAETFAFPKPITVLVGENGSGKTALLDALAVAAGSVLLELEPHATRSIQAGDILLRRHQFGEVATAEPQTPTRVSATAEIEGRIYEWRRTKSSVSGRTDRRDAISIREYGKELAGRVKSGEAQSLPLVAYYSTARLWLQKRDRPQRSKKILGPSSRLGGYTDAFAAAGSQKLFVDWMRSRTLEGLQDGSEPEDLRAVRTALEVALPEDWNSIKYDVRGDELVATKVEDGLESDRLPFHLLSDGTRTMLALVSDLAFRCAMLNPHLGWRAAAETPGLVLIDEIDLHLHPAWQRHVLRDLGRAFPRLQLVTTTHSPFIVQTRGPAELINLSRPEVFVEYGEVLAPEPADFRTKSIEDIAEQPMGVQNPMWSEDRERMLEVATRYYQLLDQAAADPALRAEIREQLDRLEEQFSENAAFNAFLQYRRASAKLDEAEES